MMFRLFWCLMVLSLGMFLARPAHPGITLLGIGTIPGDSLDLSGLKGNQTDGTPHNRLGGLGSAIAYTGQGNRYLLASDRGPKDGATDFACRVHAMDIAVNPDSRFPVELKLKATTLLKDEAGHPFVGTLSALNEKHPEKSMRLDPEGIRVGPEGTFFLSDEYGPFVLEFEQQGRRRRTFTVPGKFLTKHPGRKVVDEMPPLNNAGRIPNRGMEGLAISPDGSRLIGIMQSPLIQDGGLDKDNNRAGINCRMLDIEMSTGKTREFIYQLDTITTGVSEVLAVNDHQFLVLERDSKAGKEAKSKKIYLIDVSQASDVSAINGLPSLTLPAGIKPVKKQLFLDLLDSQFKLAGNELPEKFEGLAFGPPLADGRLLLIVTADNDFIATQPLRVYAFAIEKGLLPSYRPQRFGTGN